MNTLNAYIYLHILMGFVLVACSLASIIMNGFKEKIGSPAYPAADLATDIILVGCGTMMFYDFYLMNGVFNG